jgi:hypothetical protein
MYLALGLRSGLGLGLLFRLVHQLLRLFLGRSSALGRKHAAEDVALRESGKTKGDLAATIRGFVSLNACQFGMQLIGAQ